MIFAEKQDRGTWDDGPVLGAIDTWKWARGESTLAIRWLSKSRRFGIEVGQPSGLGERGEGAAADLTHNPPFSQGSESRPGRAGRDLGQPRQ